MKEQETGKNNIEGRGRLVKHILLLLAAALLTEILVFNFRSLQSVFYREHSWTEYEKFVVDADIYEDDIYLIKGDSATIILNDLDLDLKNIYFDVEPLEYQDSCYTETGICNVSFCVADEGNKNAYFLTGRKTAYGNMASKYQWMHPSGRVRQICIAVEIPAGQYFKIHDIVLNAKRPIIFSGMRFLIVWLLLLLGYGLRRRSRWWNEDCVRLNGWKKGVIAAVFIVFYGISWFLMSSNQLLTARLLNEEHNYHPYRELAWALDQGKCSLLEQPSRQLLIMENPYDYVQREALEIEYKFDYIYYDGQYYVYHGILPCLVFYLPLYHFTGLDMPDTIPVFLCCLMFGLGFFMLMRRIILRYFRETPFAILVLITLSGLFGCQLPGFITQATEYVLAIISGAALTVWGLYFWLSAKEEGQNRDSGKMVLCGSACMALAVACRPTLLLYSFLAFVIFGRDWLSKAGGYEKKERIGSMTAFALPYIIVAALLMYYNAVRFGSPFEFGFAYNLTIFDLRHTSFSLERIYYAVYEYLLKFPTINARFPFLEGPQYYWNGNGNSELLFDENLRGGLIPIMFFCLRLRSYSQKENISNKKVYIFSAYCSSGQAWSLWRQMLRCPAALYTVMWPTLRLRCLFLPGAASCICRKNTRSANPMMLFEK